MGKVADYVSFSLDAYYNKVKDKIVAVPTMFVWKMSNVGKVETYGVDANLAAEWALAKAWNLSLTGAYSFMQAEDVTKRGSKLWRHQIAYTPKHSGGGSVVLEMPWMNVAYNVAWSGERYRLPQNKKSNLVNAIPIIAFPCTVFSGSGIISCACRWTRPIWVEEIMRWCVTIRCPGGILKWQ